MVSETKAIRQVPKVGPKQVQKPKQVQNLEIKKPFPSYLGFKKALPTYSIKDSKLLEQKMKETEDSWKKANKELKYIPGVPIVSDKEIHSMFSDLRVRLKEAKTEQDRKNFYKQYSAVGRAAQSYIESANEFIELKNLGLNAVAFYQGIETEEQMSVSSRVLAASMIVMGIGPMKQIKNIKKLKKIEGFKSIENVNPRLAGNLSGLIKKVAAWEKNLKDKVMKERKFLAGLSRRAALGSFTGLKSMDEVKVIFSNPNFVKKMGTIVDDKERARFILDNIIDSDSLKIFKTDPEHVKRTKTFLAYVTNNLKKERDLFKGVDDFINDYVKSGGSIEETKTILYAFNERMHLAGNTIGNAYAKNIESELLHNSMHGFKNLQTIVSLYGQQLVMKFEEMSTVGKLVK